MTLAPHLSAEDAATDGIADRHSHRFLVCTDVAFDSSRTSQDRPAKVRTGMRVSLQSSLAGPSVHGTSDGLTPDRCLPKETCLPLNEQYQLLVCFRKYGFGLPAMSRLHIVH